MIEKRYNGVEFENIAQAELPTCFADWRSFVHMIVLFLCPLATKTKLLSKLNWFGIKYYDQNSTVTYLKSETILI